MEIRLLTMADYPPAYHLWATTPGMGLRELDDSPEGFGRFLRRNPSTCFAAAESGGLVGTILCGHDGRRGYIYHTAVRTDAREKGVGRALVTAALEALRNEGIHKAGLVAFCQNQLGGDFWKALGFTRREDLNYYSKPL